MIESLILNLKRHTERWKCMQERFGVLKSINIHRFDAIDGESLKTYPNLFNNVYTFACLQTHIAALKYAQKMKWDKVLIMEDDIVPCIDFDERLEFFMRNINKHWQMAYLSYFVMDYDTKENYNHILQCTKNLTSNYIQTIKGKVGAFAYIVRGTAYDKIINELSTQKHYADNILSKIQNELYTACIHPFLVYVEKGFSENSREIVEYPNIKKFWKEKLNY